MGLCYILFLLSKGLYNSTDCLYNQCKCRFAVVGINYGSYQARIINLLRFPQWVGHHFTLSLLVRSFSCVLFQYEVVLFDIPEMSRCHNVFFTIKF